MRAAVCMHLGPIGTNFNCRKLHIKGIEHRVVLDRSVIRWVTFTLAPFFTVPAVVPPVAASVGWIPNEGGGKAVLPLVLAGGGVGGPPYEGRETMDDGPLKHERIRLACGLDPAN